MNAFFVTCDLPLATFLKCSGISHPSGDYYNSRTKEWSFKDDDKCKELAQKFVNGEAKVDPLQYEMHRRALLSTAKRIRCE
jgi:hypothetical protein